jgi:SpoVK/Ycf46/Vps4 family AAA+-type ATPase
MLGALLYVQGCDVFIDSDGCLLPRAFEILRLTSDSVLLGGHKPFRFNGDMPGNDHPLMRVPFDLLTASERGEVWAALLDGTAGKLSQKELKILAGQFVLTSGQIVAAVSTALSQALQEERSLNHSDLFDAARFHSGQHLNELAHKIEPRYSWADLVLSETPLNMLRELVNMVQSRPHVLEEWGLGAKLAASNGVSALFSGPPGTGKTLAAQIVAKELGIDLYRIDLSTIVSKYIGETEKNLEHIFNEAQTSNAILLFDEADAIFGKRSEVKDAHDRYANIEVGYLLQRMEAYDGVAILATNLRANLDEAFTRRLQFIINFPFPDEEYRLHIWQVLMPPGLPCADNLDLKLMAKRFKLTGGSIRNIIVSAAYIAAKDGDRVTMEHLMHGARREFQKMGRLVNETDFALQGI